MKKLGKDVKLVMVLICTIISAAGCAGWQAMSPSQKAYATLAYYRTFSKGLTEVADIAVYIKPELAGPVAAGKTAIQILDMNLAALSEKLRVNASQLEIKEQLKVIDGAAQVANAVVGSVAAATKSSGEGSTS